MAQASETTPTRETSLPTRPEPPLSRPPRRREMPVSGGPRRFAAAVAAFAIMHLVGSAETIAAGFFAVRSFLFGDGDTPEGGQVAEAAFHVRYVVTGVGVCFGAVAAKRRWANVEDVLMGVAGAGVVTLVAFVGYNLPGAGEQRLGVGESFYYLGWIAGLWFAPFCLLSIGTGDSLSGLRRAGGVLMVTVAMAMAGLLAGMCVEGLVKIADWLDGGHAGWLQIRDNQRFWVARPVTTNTIGAAYVAVAFSTLWWPTLWRGRRMARGWLGCVSAGTIAYSGLFGAVFYDNGAEVSPAGGFLAFGALPAVVGLAVLVAYRLTRQEAGGDTIGWPVSPRFWRLLPVGFALGLGAVALWGLAPLGRQSPPDAAAYVVVVGHLLNGLLLGVALRAMPWAFGLVPDEGR